MLNLYRELEDWHGAPNPDYRGTRGLLYLKQEIGTGPIVPAMFEGARSVGIQTFDSINGRMMEGPGGCSLTEFRMRGRHRAPLRSTDALNPPTRPVPLLIPKCSESGTQLLLKERLRTSSNSPRELFSGLPLLGKALRYRRFLKSLASSVRTPAFRTGEKTCPP